MRRRGSPLVVAVTAVVVLLHLAVAVDGVRTHPFATSPGVYDNPCLRAVTLAFYGAWSGNITHTEATWPPCNVKITFDQTHFKYVLNSECNGGFSRSEEPAGRDADCQYSVNKLDLAGRGSGTLRVPLLDDPYVEEGALDTADAPPSESATIGTPERSGAVEDVVMDSIVFSDLNHLSFDLLGSGGEHVGSVALTRDTPQVGIRTVEKVSINAATKRADNDEVHTTESDATSAVDGCPFPLRPLASPLECMQSRLLGEWKAAVHPVEGKAYNAALAFNGTAFSVRLLDEGDTRTLADPFGGVNSAALDAVRTYGDMQLQMDGTAMFSFTIPRVEQQHDAASMGRGRAFNVFFPNDKSAYMKIATPDFLHPQAGHAPRATGPALLSLVRTGDAPDALVDELERTTGHNFAFCPTSFPPTASYRSFLERLSGTYFGTLSESLILASNKSGNAMELPKGNVRLVFSPAGHYSAHMVTAQGGAVEERNPFRYGMPHDFMSKLIKLYDVEEDPEGGERGDVDYSVIMTLPSEDTMRMVFMRVVLRVRHAESKKQQKKKHFGAIKVMFQGDATHRVSMDVTRMGPASNFTDCVGKWTGPWCNHCTLKESDCPAGHTLASYSCTCVDAITGVPAVAPVPFDADVKRDEEMLRVEAQPPPSPSPTPIVVVRTNVTTTTKDPNARAAPSSTAPASPLDSAADAAGDDAGGDVVSPADAAEVAEATAAAAAAGGDVDAVTDEVAGEGLSVGVGVEVKEEMRRAPARTERLAHRARTVFVPGEDGELLVRDVERRDHEDGMGEPGGWVRLVLYAFEACVIALGLLALGMYKHAQRGGGGGGIGIGGGGGARDTHEPLLHGDTELQMQMSEWDDGAEAGEERQFGV